MKLSSFAKLAKKYKKCDVIFPTDRSPMWLGTPMGLYCAEGLPRVHGDDQVRRILSLSKRQMKNIMVEERQYTDYAECLRQEGFNLMQGVAGQKEAFPVDMMGLAAGISAVSTKAGDVYFFLSELLDPVLDDLEDNYTEYFVRTKPNGKSYIAIMSGMFLVAEIMTTDFVTEHYLDELKKFVGMCQRRYDADRLAKGLREKTEVAEQPA